MLKNCIIIPARYNSKRLFGKPLYKLKNGQSLIKMTLDKIKKKVKLEDIYVCTDNVLVKQEIESYLINKPIVVKKKCLNGTERASYALSKIKRKYDYATIVSCDMPFMDPNVLLFIEKKSKLKNNKYADGYTIHCNVKNEKIYKDKNVAKIVLTNSNRILYLSRGSIPNTKNFKSTKIFSHHGIVMLKWDVLKKYKNLSNSKLQISEDNEWLKLIENDFTIKSFLYKKLKPEINTKSDLNKIYKLK